MNFEDLFEVLVFLKLLERAKRAHLASFHYNDTVSKVEEVDSMGH